MIMDAWLAVVPAISVYVTLAYCGSLVLRRNDIADVAWGPGFLLIACIVWWMNGAPAGRPLLVVLLVAAWAVRLALHIGIRNRGKPEDHRYAAWRASWGTWFHLRAYLQVFVLQGLLMLVVSAPVVAAVSSPQGGFSNGAAAVFMVAGLALYIIGFVFETVGDIQLSRFMRDPSNRGRIMQDGLWGYTRHPNYFGEVLVWWGVWLIALPSPYGWVAVIGPLTITFLILKVSGIPMMEAHMATKPGFDAYRRSVNRFIPGPPKPRT